MTPRPDAAKFHDRLASAISRWSVRRAAERRAAGEVNVIAALE
jgi:hypothetical protein